jgi:hypothetical protein
MASHEYDMPFDRAREHTTRFVMFDEKNIGQIEYRNATL